VGLFTFLAQVPIPSVIGKWVSLLLHQRKVEKLERRQEELTASEHARLDVYRERIRTWSRK
jgi:hypothetical protein